MRNRDTSALTITIAVIAFIAFAVVAIRSWDYDRHDVSFGPNNYYKGEVRQQDDPKKQYANHNNLDTIMGGKCDTVIAVSARKKYVEVKSGDKVKQIDQLWVEDGKPITFTLNDDGTVDQASNPMTSMKMEGRADTDKTYLPFKNASGTVALIAPSRVDFVTSNTDSSTQTNIEMVIQVGPDWQIQFSHLVSWFCCIGKENPWEHTIVVGAGGTADTKMAPAGAIIGAADKNTEMRVLYKDSGGQWVPVDPWLFFANTGLSVDPNKNSSPILSSIEFNKSGDFDGGDDWWGGGGGWGTDPTNPETPPPDIKDGVWVGVDNDASNAYSKALSLWSGYHAGRQKEGSCWARALQAIAGYWYDQGSYSRKVSWSVLFQKHLQLYDGVEGSRISETDVVFRLLYPDHDWWQYNGDETSFPTQNDIIAKIQEDVPVYIGLWCASAGHGGHAIVIVGYTPANGGQFLVVDSNLYAAEYMSVESVFSRYRGAVCYGDTKGNKCTRGVKPVFIYEYD